jgi:Tfp pilus assembly protein FimV
MKLRFKIIYLSLMVGIPGGASAVGSIADVTVYDRVENRALPIHQHNGRYYVVGKPGNEYQIRLQNRGSQEILSVVSVDGVNAVSGETANWAQTGYVLGNYQAFDIRGWRKSMDRIAAFYFTEHQNSYAARTGRPNNVGVIGVAVFRKKYEPPVRIDPPVRPWSRPRSESPFPSSDDSAASGAAQDNGRSADASAPPTAEAPSAAREGRSSGYGEMARAPQKSPTLGTGHGRSEESQVTYTNFERASSTPAEVITIHYDTYDNLVAQGVINQPAVYARPTPVPFPGQFVPDPR